MSHARSLLAALTGLAAAATALAGCPAVVAPGPAGASRAPGAASPATGGAKASPAPTIAASPAAGAAALGRSLSEGLADERDLADYGYIFDDGSGIVAAGGGNMVAAGGGNMVAAGGGNMVAAGGLNLVLAAVADDEDVDAPQRTPDLGALAEAGLRDKLRAQRKAIVAKAAARLAARADRQAFVDAVAKAAVTTDAAKGTKTYRFVAGLPWKGFTRQVHFEYTVEAATSLLVHAYSAVLRPRPDRPRKPFHQTRREYTLTAGGGYQVAYFQSLPLRARDLRRIVRWEHGVAVDGTVTGGGTITWQPLGDPKAKPARQVPIRISGDEAAPAFLATEAGLEAAIQLPVEGAPRATAREAGAEAHAPLDVTAVAAEADAEDPTTPATP